MGEIFIEMKHPAAGTIFVPESEVEARRRQGYRIVEPDTGPGETMQVQRAATPPPPQNDPMGPFDDEEDDMDLDSGDEQEDEEVYSHGTDS